MNGSEKLLETGVRWWESYLVRYGIGTIIGACCMYFLLSYMGDSYLNKFYLAPPMEAAKQQHVIETCFAALGASNIASGNSLCKIIVESQSKNSIDLSTLFLLGILGFAYCYIASAPGLLIHGVRQQIISASSSTSTDSAKNGCFCFVVASSCCYVTALVTIFSLGCIFTIGRCNDFYNILIVLFFSVFIGGQLYLLCKEYNSNKLLRFYMRLHQTRQSGMIDPDSYKHLREHGNAFFIVLLEIVFLLFSVVSFNLFKFPGVIVMSCLWILPSALIYFLGHKIEAELKGRIY